MPIYIYQTSAKKSEEFCEALFEEAHQFLCLLDQKNAEGELAVILQPTDDSARSWLLLKRLLSQISTLEDLVLGDDLGANDEDGHLQKPLANRRVV